MHHLLHGLLAVAALLTVPSGRAQTCTYAVAAAGTSDFVFNGVGDPPIRLFRGFRYQFNVTSGSIHPFWIKSVQGASGSANAFSNGVTGNGTTSGQVIFQVPTNAPDTLFYNCGNHASMTGQFQLSDPPPVAILNAYLQNDAVVISSLGTNLLRTQVEALQDLTKGLWEVIPVITNQFAGGTNTTVAGPLITSLLWSLRVKACCD
jgi:hypothetical protein